MKMKNPQNPTPVFEELWYLVHNKKVNQEILRIRRKHKIPEEGFKDGIADWVLNNESNDIGQLSGDVNKIIMRSRLGKSKYVNELIYLLQGYVFSNKLSSMSKDAKRELGEIGEPTISIKQSFLGLILSFNIKYDTSKTEIKNLLKGEWRKIRKAQEKFAGLLLKPSKDFEFKAKLWEMYNLKGKNERELEDLITSGEFDKDNQELVDLSRYDIKKLLKAMDRRISTSFQ